MARTTDESVLLSRYLDADGRLIVMPRRHNDRLIVLRRMARTIETGRDFDESEVNARLRGFDDDVATLRRYLVDVGLLERLPPGVYRRPDEGSLR